MFMLINVFSKFRISNQAIVHTQFNHTVYCSCTTHVIAEKSVNRIDWCWLHGCQMSQHFVAAIRCLSSLKYIV